MGNGDVEEKLIITPKAKLECFRIYTQYIAKGKGAPTAAVMVSSVGLGAQMADTQNFGVYLNKRDELDKGG